MDFSILNDRQREAVECLEGPLLVLAGAGSGKTRVLTYRIANLVEHGVKPWNILALTFTNKAAEEMRARAAALVGDGGEALWVTTFHKLCSRLLRVECGRLGFETNFSIYDDSDQMKVVSDILKDMGMSERSMPRREMKERISNAKNKSLNPDRYVAEHYADDGGMTAGVYSAYRKRLMAANAFDFDDLILKVIELFEGFPDILEKYRARFRYVLVDEYQDTNMPQYRLVELLCRAHGNLCVVGDDDQSIYGWRGADVENILSFEKDFKGAKVVRLEQNYRSTRYILDAANAVIRNNEGRKPKTLWTDKPGGDLIVRFEAANEREEAAYICKKILEGVRDGGGYGDYAILYRMNAQSRVLESTLVNYGIPHKIYGGFRFYERREIADIMGYLRLIANPNDDVAFSRVVNVPRRGIGDKAVEELRAAAQASGESLLFAAMGGEGIPARTLSKIKPFAELMAELIAESTLMPLSRFTERLIDKIEYEAYLLSDDKKGEAESRMENLRELVGNIKEIEADIPEGGSALTAFLENVALVSDIDALEEGAGSVSLMTLHSAKGLEFPVVFLAGLEENVFPTYRARNDLTSFAMEEERRLCYVGMTRAREKLYLLNAACRSLFGEGAINRPSRFLEEVPGELVAREHGISGAPQQRKSWEFERDEHQKKAYASAQGFGVTRSGIKPPAGPAKPVQRNEGAAFAPFQRVRHEKFGGGIVLEVAGSGASATVTVDFDEGGVKRFAAAYAPLTTEQ
ncbi:MAG: ATP-dependent DNA helicase PcrA [Firmicutes bacterium ADurb.Bin248]|nr:MAG: ATP-dependent DNA helicase PcrA [Firmicutes bacterium ADurb.Bin248]HOG01108.1 UvrD-helicase domain-containing protein [Clostridia bacterium]HPK15688.1 UvrD-helicase domain-containing protein [Clostridia bacterium]